MRVQGIQPLVLERGNKGDLKWKTKMESQSYSNDKSKDDKGKTDSEGGHTLKTVEATLGL